MNFRLSNGRNASRLPVKFATKRRMERSFSRLLQKFQETGNYGWQTDAPLSRLSSTNSLNAVDCLTMRRQRHVILSTCYDKLALFRAISIWQPALSVQSRFAETRLAETRFAETLNLTLNPKPNPNP